MVKQENTKGSYTGLKLRFNAIIMIAKKFTLKVKKKFNKN